MENYEKQKFITTWEKSRTQGKWWFMLKYFAIYIILILTLRTLLDLFEVDLETAIKQNFAVGEELAFTVVLAIALGWFLWWWMERKYQRLKSEL
ncbi:MAG: hypothetical protein H6574_17025 [Lewinellaceae bacterium]|nr:hypothetical protein [Saprospiraceae bacterium]MCB9332777.1 hypothetical protein [Lewinellaceae bacterium]